MNKNKKDAVNQSRPSTRDCTTGSDRTPVRTRQAFIAAALLALTLAGIFFTVSSAAARTNRPSTQPDQNNQWHLTADHVRYDSKLKQYLAQGNVIIRKEDKKLTADRIRFDQNTMQAFADGHVVMTTGSDTATGDRIELDLDAEVGTIYNGTVFIRANHFYLKGDRINKTGENTYSAQQITVTTCDGPRPSWHITGKDLEVTIEGYGTLKHAALWAGKMPMLYTPYFFFPTKQKRQSGFLTPEFSTSNRKGSAYIQPYFWAISESSDATFYAHYMEKRGFKYGAEYRYVKDKDARGTFMFDALDDRKVDDGEGSSSDDYGYTDDDYLRPNSDRYWFRAKIDQPLPNDFNAKLDLDIVSDQDYLHEFKTGYTGFNETNAYFEEEFGRSLDDYDDSTRINRLNLNRIWQTYSLNAEVRWYDDVILRRQADEDTTLQRLPFIEFDASRQRLLNTPFYYKLNTEYTYFYRQDTDTDLVNGNRMDVYPRVFLPLNYKNYLSIEPSVGFRETLWYIGDIEEGSDIDDHYMHREIYDLKLDISTNLYKMFDTNHKRIDKIRHRLTPKITYEYIPDVNQDGLPRFESTETDDDDDDDDDDNGDDTFDSIDRIDKENKVTYSISNIFTARYKKIQQETSSTDKQSQQDNDTEPVDYGYREFAWFQIEQSYDFNEAREDENEPFSVISGDLELYPTVNFSVLADAEWDVYEDDFQSRNIAVRLSDDRGDRVQVEHRYFEDFDATSDDNDDSSESIYLNALLIVSDRLSTYVEYERNLEDREEILKRIGLLYRSQCWALDVNYSEEEENDQKVAFMISLQGLGELGSTFTGFDF